MKYIILPQTSQGATIARGRTSITADNTEQLTTKVVYAAKRAGAKTAKVLVLADGKPAGSWVFKDAAWTEDTTRVPGQLDLRDGKKPGVIQAMIALLTDGERHSFEDLVEIISSTKGRDPRGVRNTVRAQLTRITVEKGVSVLREREGGVVYYRGR